MGRSHDVRRMIYVDFLGTRNRRSGSLSFMDSPAEQKITARRCRGCSGDFEKEVCQRRDQQRGVRTEKKRPALTIKKGEPPGKIRCPSRPQETALKGGARITRQCFSTLTGRFYRFQNLFCFLGRFQPNLPPFRSTFTSFFGIFFALNHIEEQRRSSV